MLKIVPMQQHHVPRVVQVHLHSFSGFFLSFLGPRFLSLYYSEACGSPEGINFVCINDAEEPVGFVVGSFNPQGFYSRLLKRRWYRFLLASSAAILRKPLIIARLARAVIYPSRNPFGNDVAGLFSIAVSPQMQASGAGTMLIKAFINASTAKGCKRIVLSTDHYNNDTVNAFYRKLGFRIIRTFTTPEERKMNEYSLTI